MSFNVGDRVIVNGEFEGMPFCNASAYIYKLDEDIDMVGLYMPSWADEKIGHYDANEYADSSFPVGIDSAFGSWNVPMEWLDNGNIVLEHSFLEKVGKHYKVINKIKQMETRRKQLGYKTYQFFTGQDDEFVVQLKSDSWKESTEVFRRIIESSYPAYPVITPYEIDF
jgi:hypothetical protein